MDIEVKDLEPKPYLGIRMKLTFEEMPKVMGSLYGRVYSHLAEVGAKPAGPSLTLVHEMLPGALDLECGVFVDEGVQGRGDIKAGKTPGGRCAMTVYTGPYEGLGPAWEQFSTEVASRGMKSQPPSWEEYIVTPQDTGDPAKCQTVLIELVE